MTLREWIDWRLEDTRRYSQMDGVEALKRLRLCVDALELAADDIYKGDWLFGGLIVEVPMRCSTVEAIRAALTDVEE